MIIIRLIQVFRMPLYVLQAYGDNFDEHEHLRQVSQAIDTLYRSPAQL